MDMLSIVIPVYNNFNYTKNCLNHLVKLNHQIIVVDNNSSDQTLNISKLFNVKYIRNNENLGFGKAVNIGINNSDGDQIMILNNDIKFGKDYQSFFNIICPDNYLMGPTGGMVDPITFGFQYETNDPNKIINYMSGWCLTATKNTWNKLKVNDGPFDDKTFFLYYEDTDLGFRAKQLNIEFKIIDCPLIHIGKQTSKMLNTYKHYLESKEKFNKKWKK